MCVGRLTRRGTRNMCAGNPPPPFRVAADGLFSPGCLNKYNNKHTNGQTTENKSTVQYYMHMRAYNVYTL